MKSTTTLVRIAGVVNTLFALFHVLLAWNFHHQTQLPASLRSILEIFNGCGSLTIVFLAVAGLAYSQEVITTAIGRLTLWLGAALYILRAVLEYALSPKPSPVIAAICLAAGSIYIAAIILARTASRTQPAS